MGNFNNVKIIWGESKTEREREIKHTIEKQVKIIIDKKELKS